MNDGSLPLTKGFENINLSRKEYPMILVASASRSGSTYLANMIKDISKLHYYRYCQAYSNLENELYLPALCFAHEYRTISILHIKANILNVKLIELFGIKTIITIRDIFETVASCARYIRRITHHPYFEMGHASTSMAWFDLNQTKLSDDKLIDYIIDLYVPWYINFFVSWTSVVNRGEVDAIWVNRDEVKKHPKETLENILDFCNLDSLDHDWDKIINSYPPEETDSYLKQDYPISTEQWQGKITEQQKQNVRQYAKYYPDIDFSPLGI